MTIVLPQMASRLTAPPPSDRRRDSMLRVTSGDWIHRLRLPLTEAMDDSPLFCRFQKVGKWKPQRGQSCGTDNLISPVLQQTTP